MNFEIISIGRLSRVKGHVVLLEALATLVAESLPLRVTLVGDGEERSVLERAAADANLLAHVAFTGWRDHQLVFEMLRRSDLCVMPSFAEGIPLTLMEAMAVGTPCIATYVGGVPELIQHGVSGELVPAGDSRMLGDSIRRLALSADLRKRYAQAARVQIEQYYDLANNGRELADLFQRELSQ